MEVCARFAVLLAFSVLVGCQGSGRVELAALDFRAIDPPAARFYPIELDRCYWWADDVDQVWIAMEQSRPVMLGMEKFLFRTSLVLERLPRGESRNYLVAKRELRAVVRLGGAEARFISQAGIVALYRDGNDRLHGSFRLQVKHQAPALLGLGGWTKPRQYLMLGTFDAIKNERKGRPIAKETESQGWDRQPPATQPAADPDKVPE